MVPTEEGVERFREKEDKETTLSILPSGSHGITVTEDDIATLRREGIEVNGDNTPATDNVMQSDDVFTTPSPLTFGFHGVNPWHQSGNFPVGSANLKMIPIPRIQLMSRLDFFMKLHFMEYIKNVVIPGTNKIINSAMNFSEYFRMIICHFIMDCYVGQSVRELFLKDPITPQKGAPTPLNHIISRRILDKITQVKSYTNLAIPEFNDPFFQQR